MLLLLLSLQATAQYKTKTRVNTTDERGTKSLVQKANAAQSSVRIKKTAANDIPAGYASVTLTVGDVWGDGSGYQMLLDADAEAFGAIFPETGPLTAASDASDADYAEFEFKIPENADGAMSTENIVIDNSVTILIPAGTYDWCITNPTPGDRIWIASQKGSIGGRADDFCFIEGVAYEFIVSLSDDGNDQTDLEISGLETTYSINNVTSNSAEVNWESSAEGKTNIYLRYRKTVSNLYISNCEDEEEFDELQQVDLDGDGNYWFYGGYDNAHSGNAVWASYSYNSELGSLNPDNLLLLPTMDLSGKTLTFWASSLHSAYPDNMGVFFLPDGEEIENLRQLQVYTEIPADWTEYTIDLKDLGVGQIVFRHFDSYDQYCLLLDDISVISEDINIEDYDWVTIDNVTEHPYVITGLKEGTEYEVQMRAEQVPFEESVFFTTKSGISTGIVNGQRDAVKVQSEEWYTIDGRKLKGMPTAKGVYIHNGKAVVK
ncbi:MAG: DUF2436 domain-containing protein [Oscillospiraceae bacterium]|nr:DUF2436 domain-containing protein [Oscillospiraceae bacterium]MBP5355279.1 DUF2436 domain-containing protein [Prevotella sp.]